MELPEVRRLATEVSAAHEALRGAVSAARDEGASWADIGVAAGMSKQAAHQRWGMSVGGVRIERDAPKANKWHRLACGHRVHGPKAGLVPTCPHC